MKRSLILFSAITVLALCALSRAGESKPALSAGQKALPFEAKALDGRAVKFPDAYKGKVVLLDFWATWCGPCLEEIPNLVAAHQKYQSKGFEILGVSLDQARWGPTIVQFTRQNKMPWPQIYDGKYWKAELAVKYDIHSIPRAFLVDGDTGIILAEGDDVRARRLAPAIEKALAAKAKK
jgi:thiol-disulfide isomerase/thioredoxin